MKKGDYVFNAQVKRIAGYTLNSPALATLAFSVDELYMDFLKDNVVPVLAICFVMIICIGYYGLHKRKHPRTYTRRRKRRHR